MARLHVGVATIPRREGIFPEVLASLLNQTVPPDKIFVALNNYKRKPTKFPSDERIEYRLPGRGNRGDVEKFFPLTRQEAEYTASTDDDIIYPKDYFECLMRWSRQFDDRAALGIYGRVLQELPCRRFYGNKIYCYRSRMGKPAQVSVLGTGTFLVRSSLLSGFQMPKDPAFVNRGDILIAVELSRRGVPKVVIPRQNWWMRDTPAQFNSSTHNSRTREKYLAGTTKLVNRYADLLRKDGWLKVPTGVARMKALGKKPQWTATGIRIR